MHRFTRKLLAGACAIGVIAAGTGPAGADDVSNDLDTTVDAVAEAMALEVGGADGSTVLYVRVSNGDGKNGCNLTGSTTLDLAVSSSNAAVATVSPASMTFTSCADRQAVTVTPVSQGSATVSVSQTSNTTGATFNLAPATFSVNVAARAVTNTPPVLTAPEAVGPIEATGPSGATVAYAASAADNQDGTLMPVCSPASGSTFAIGSTTVSCSVTDGGGLTATRTFPVVVEDTAPPVIVGMPGDRMVEATGADGATVTWTSPTASDLVDGAVAVSCSPASGATFGIGVVHVRCSATDAHGNSASESFSVTVTDTQAPAFSNVPGNQTLEATSAAGAVASWTDPTATDLVDGDRPVVCSPGSGSTFALGAAHDVTCTTTDTRGNSATAKFSIQVIDTTAPVLSGIPASETLEATGADGAPASWSAPTALDIVDGDVAVLCDAAPGTTFRLGTTTVTCSATDAAGSPATGTFTITVEDTTAPALNGVPENQVLEATSAAGATAQWSAPTALDIVDGTVAVLCDATPGATFPLGTTTVTCTTTDTTGNDTTDTFTITIHDTTAPVISGLPAIHPLDATGADGAPVSWPSPTALDIVDGDVEVVCDASPATTFPLGTTTVSCSATDAAGNRASGTFSIIVEDRTAPVIVGMPGDRMVEATGADGATVTWTSPTASDLVDGTVAVSCSPASGATFGIGVVHVRCSATDAHGNSASESFSVTVTDTQAPAFSNVPGNQTLEATSAAGAVASWTDPTASDLVDGDRPVVCSPGSGSTFALGAAHDVTCTTTDTRGNSAMAKFSINVDDTTAPVLSGIPASETLEATGADGAPLSWALPTALDIVDGGVAVRCDTTPGTTFGLGTTTVTCSATDAAGNPATGTFTITVHDTTAPALTGVPDDQTLEATSADGAPASWTPPTALDIVDGTVAVICDATPGATFPLGTTTVSCTTTDTTGNDTTDTFTITVRDTTAPAVTVVGGPTAGSSPMFGNVPAAPTCTATDVVSGTVSCAVTGWSDTVGHHVLRATATDAAGNEGEVTRSYSVTGWTTGGFYNPVDSGGVVNTLKGGSTVPLKFEVFAGSIELTQLSTITSFTQAKVECESGTVVDEITIVSTGGTSLRYDATGGQFIQNWQTPKQPGACYLATVTMADRSTISARFRLR